MKGKLFFVTFTLLIIVSCGEADPTSSSGPNIPTSSVSFAGLESISNVTSSKFDLNWTDTFGVALYLIYNMTSGSAVYHSSISAPASSTTITGLIMSTNYTFRVRILDTSGLTDYNTINISQTTSDYSNAISMQTGTGTYMDTGITTDLSGSGDFSISAWFKGSDASYLITQSHLVAYSSDFIIGGSSSELFWMRSVTLGTSATVQDGNWHHIVFVWNSTSEKYKGYVDGVLLGESTQVSGYGGIGTSVIIGSRGDAGTSYSTGLVDEVTIYQVALTDSDVITLYNSGVPDIPNSTDLISWWRMGDDTGDSSTGIIDQQSSNDITSFGMTPASLVTDAP